MIIIINVSFYIVHFRSVWVCAFKFIRWAVDVYLAWYAVIVWSLSLSHTFQHTLCVACSGVRFFIQCTLYIYKEREREREIPWFSVSRIRLVLRSGQHIFIYIVKCPFCFLCAVICWCRNSITASQMRVLLHNLSVLHRRRFIQIGLVCFIFFLSNSILCTSVCNISFVCFLNSEYGLVGGIFTKMFLEFRIWSTQMRILQKQICERMCMSKNNTIGIDPLS